MRQKYTRLTAVLLFLAWFAVPSWAQRDNTPSIISAALRGWEYSLKAGFGIGGTAPLPIPGEIRKIDSYRPGLNIAIEGTATRWIDPAKRWGVSVGVRLEQKSMETEATTKNYSMKILNANGGELAGLWTGGVHTRVENSYLTIPLLMNYKVSSRWKLVAGPYFSYLLEGTFDGDVYEGHLRTPDATGSKVVFEGDSRATYDFSENLRHFQWGVQLGGEWRAFKHLSVHADLTWGLNNIFEKDFDTVTFNMYPIYLNLGFGYAF